MSRKIIQISVTSSYRGNIENIIALCDDGTLWNKQEGVPWFRLGDIPQEEQPPLKRAPNYIDDLGCEADF